MFVRIDSDQNKYPRKRSLRQPSCDLHYSLRHTEPSFIFLIKIFSVKNESTHRSRVPLYMAQYRGGGHWLARLLSTRLWPTWLLPTGLSRLARHEVTGLLIARRLNATHVWVRVISMMTVTRTTWGRTRSLRTNLRTWIRCAWLACRWWKRHNGWEDRDIRTWGKIFTFFSAVSDFTSINLMIVTAARLR